MPRRSRTKVKPEPQQDDDAVVDAEKAPKEEVEATKEEAAAKPSAKKKRERKVYDKTGQKQDTPHEVGSLTTRVTHYAS